MRWIVAAAVLGLAGVCSLDGAAPPCARGRGPEFLVAAALSPVVGAVAPAPEAPTPAASVTAPAGVTSGRAEAGTIPLEAVVVDSATGAPLGRAYARQTEENAPWDLEPGERARLRFVVDLPAGYATEGLPEFTGPVSIFATRVRAVLPLRREAWVELDARHAEGTPVRGLELVQTWLGGTEPTFEEVEEELLDEGEIPEEPEEVLEEWIDDMGAPLDVRLEPAGRAGRFRLRGVPHLVGERIRFVVASRHRNAYGEVILGRVGEAVLRTVVLPAECNRRYEFISSIGWSSG